MEKRELKGTLNSGHWDQSLRERCSFGLVVLWLWGIGFDLFILGGACIGLVPRALEALRHPLTWGQKCAYAASVLLIGVIEGYFAFHRSFAPMLAARVYHLMRYPHPSALTNAALCAVLPAYSFALFYAPLRRVIISWAVVVSVTAIVIIVHHLPQPWRGIIDGGVVAGLGFGTFSTAIFAVRVAWEFPLPCQESEAFQREAIPLWVTRVDGFTKA